MAFAKAKIQRFNEVIGCAPPPGTYQPKWQEKPLLGLIERERRFNDETSKAEVNDTPMKIPKKGHHPFKSRSSRRETYMKDESFSSSTSAMSSVKNEHPKGDSIQEKMCNCSILIDHIKRRYEYIIKGLSERLMVLSKHEVRDFVNQATDSEKVNINHPGRAKSTSESIDQSHQQEIIEYRLKIAELQDTIDCLTAEKNVLSMDYFKMKKNINELEEKIKVANLKISEAESLAESRSESIDILKRGIHHLKADLEYSKFQVQNLQLKFDNTNQELIMERSKKEELQAKCEYDLTKAEEVVNKKSEEIEGLTNSLKENLLILDHEKKLRAEQIEALCNELNKMKQIYDADGDKQRELEEELCSTREELDTALSKLAEMEYVLHDAVAEIDNSESNVYISKENLTVDKIIDFFKSILKASNETELLNEELGIEIKMREFDIQNLQQLIGPFREQLENYELERQALEKLTKQTKGEFEALSLQHAALLGHQNHKQKIQYMVKLKEKNIQLSDEIEDLKRKLRQNERTIEKLTNQSKDEPKTQSSKALHRSRKENEVSSS